MIIESILVAVSKQVGIVFVGAEINMMILMTFKIME
jgi:hypothetical protein